MDGDGRGLVDVDCEIDRSEGSLSGRFDAESRVRAHSTSWHVLQRTDTGRESARDDSRIESKPRLQEKEQVLEGGVAAAGDSVTRQIREDEELARRMQEEEEEMGRREVWDEQVARRLQAQFRSEGSRGRFRHFRVPEFSRIRIVPDREEVAARRRQEARERRHREERQRHHAFNDVLREGSLSMRDFNAESPSEAYRNFRRDLISHMRSGRQREPGSGEEDRNEIGGAPPPGLFDSPLLFEDLIRIGEMLGDRRRGADQRTIDSHTYTGKYSKNSDGDNTQCTVCMSEFEEGEDIRRLRCFHAYHIPCIDPWLKSNSVCPVCRVKIDDDD